MLLFLSVFSQVYTENQEQMVQLNDRNNFELSQTGKVGASKIGPEKNLVAEKINMKNKSSTFHQDIRKDTESVLKPERPHFSQAQSCKSERIYFAKTSLGHPSTEGLRKQPT